MRSTDVSWEEQTQADAGRLWAGGAVSALVAAGVALIAVLVMQRLFDVTVRTPTGGHPGDALTALPIGAALVTLLATGLLHLLMATTPSAPHFFGWITGLALALVLLVVILNDTKPITRIETGAFYLLIGVAIISSLLAVSRTAVRYHRRQDYRDYRDDYPQQGYPPREPGYDRYR